MTAPAVISGRSHLIQSSPDGSTWTDRSDVIHKLTPGGGERATAEVQTAGTSDVPVTTRGKRSAATVVVEFLYTETNGELGLAMQAAYLAAGDWYWRWSPKGGNSGDRIYTTSAGTIQTDPLPAVDQSDTAKAIMCSTTTHHAEITHSTVA